jgi:hypothetical protein
LEQALAIWCEEKIGRMSTKFQQRTGSLSILDCTYRAIPLEK